MGEILMWALTVHGPRAGEIQRVRETVDRSAILLDFRLYSDVSLVLQVEAAENRLGDLWDGLSRLGALTADRPPGSALTRDRLLVLNVTFAGAGGDLGREVPAVPG
jgi:hypothetical protein